MTTDAEKIIRIIQANNLDISRAFAALHNNSAVLTAIHGYNRGRITESELEQIILWEYPHVIKPMKDEVVFLVIPEILSFEYDIYHIARMHNSLTADNRHLVTLWKAASSLPDAYRLNTMSTPEDRHPVLKTLQNSKAAIELRKTWLGWVWCITEVFE